MTLVAQISKSALSFLSGMIVARGLGPAQYGNLAFLLGSFTAIRLVIDIASGQAFFTLSAQRPRSREFYLYYATWLAVFQIFTPLLCITLLFPQHVVDAIWQSQGRERVALAFLATHLQYLFWPQIIQVGEVVRRTTVAQMLTIGVSLTQFSVTALLFLSGFLTLTNYLVLIVCTFSAGVIAAFFLLPRPWHPSVEPEPFREVFSEFATFCKPLIVSMSLQATSGLVEVWLLQRYAGSVQQGYFALGMQISLVALLATTALQNIFWREVAELEGNGNEVRTRDVYIKTSRVLFLAACVPIAFLIAWTPQVVLILLGTKYSGAAPTIGIMFLYPLSQAILTLAIVMYSVMHETRMLAIFSSVYALLYIVASYVLLAPPDAALPGLGLGALANGAKLTLFGFVQLLVWETWIQHKKGWQSDWPHRLRLLMVLAAISLIARAAGGALLIRFAPLVAMLAATLIYLGLTLTAVLRWPAMMGVPVSFEDVMGRLMPSWMRNRNA